ncbi:hypothetical protein FXO37_36833 [Capsicum annuum]|nr:hypothetical protein FXO37_36833 [Capsicum annuum]
MKTQSSTSAPITGSTVMRMNLRPFAIECFFTTEDGFSQGWSPVRLPQRPLLPSNEALIKALLLGIGPSNSLYDNTTSCKPVKLSNSSGMRPERPLWEIFKFDKSSKLAS